MTDPTSRIRVRDLLERILWTAVAAALTALVGAPILDVEAWRAAAFAGGTAAVTGVLVIARWRLSILPDPGAGLPGIRPDHTGPWTSDREVDR